jgi:acetyl-CoA C-acetyltransferase
MWWPNLSAPGSFAQLAAAYRAKHRKAPEDLKRAMAHISVKSHANGNRNPKAHLSNRIDIDTVLGAPMVAEPLGLYDCCGVSDGSACAIVTTPEIARSLGKHDIVSVKALQLAVSNGTEAAHNSWDGSYFATTRVASKRAYKEAGIDNPREDLDLIEVHDCFSVTELVTMEDLYVSPEGGAIKDVLDGFYDADGQVPCQIDGGLKCFGHPIGSSGMRMIYEIYLQMQGKAGPRQRQQTPRYGLTHNLGGFPHQNVCSISVIGRYGE